MYINLKKIFNIKNYHFTFLPLMSKLLGKRNEKPFLLPPSSIYRTIVSLKLLLNTNRGFK